MTDRELCRLMAWFSPAFPVGAYAYSHGLETAVTAGLVRNGAELAAWLEDVLRHGSGFSDALFLGRAWQAGRTGDEAAIAALSEQATAFQPTAELRLETTQQGRAFLAAMVRAWPCPALTRLQAMCLPALPYPVAVGVACAGHGLGLRPVLAGYLHAFAANLTSAGVRLVPLGQSDGLGVLARLEVAVEAVTDAALAAGPDDPASAVPMVDWCSIRHETDYTRLFRS